MELIKVSDDERRTIYAVNNMLLNDAEFTFIHLNKGYAIGGCVHSKKEYYVVVKGIVFVKTNEAEFILSAGEGGIFEAGEPHAFFGMNNCIISEWGISAKEKENDKKDNKMIKFVDAVNEK